MERIYTDNPLIDEIVYQIQGMIREGIVLKNEQEALKYETVQSKKEADKYKDIMNGTIRFARFDYEYSDLIKIPSMTHNDAVAMAMNNALIPEVYKPLLLKNKCDEFVASYQDLNNYYRKLNGLPDLGKEGLRLTKEQLYSLNSRTFDGTKYIHEMTDSEINLLTINGIIDELKATYPTEGYLYHLGDKKIDPMFARGVYKFELLYLPTCDAYEVHTRFKELIRINREYILQTTYSDAYKFNSEYYDNFTMIMIIVQALTDMIILSPEYLISRDVFDIRTIQYIFESQGVEFFPEIPIKYQKRLIKNLNNILKFKSCDKNFIDIASLFGFNDFELFKYYILKDPIMLENGTYKKDMVIDPKTGELVEDYEANYELKFVKVPLSGMTAEEAIKDIFNHIPYEDITSGDPYWNGAYTDEYVRHEILKREFNMRISKYIGADSVISLTDMTMQMVYFMNMLMYSVDTSQVSINISEFSASIKYPLVDCFIALFSLSHLYLNISDTITYDPIRYLAVCGYNFDTDMAELAAYVKEQGFTLEELGVADFQQPLDGIFTIDQLIQIYTKNNEIYDHIAYQLNKADDKRIYDIYRHLYQSLYITRLNFEHFKTDNIYPETYAEYLNMRNSPLYNYIAECEAVGESEEKQLLISKYINIIVDNMYIYLDEEEFKYLFTGVPTASADYIRQYLYKILNFFRSYQVTFVNSSNIYLFDDILENKITVIDEILMKITLSPNDYVTPFDNMLTQIHLAKDDNLGIRDMIFIQNQAGYEEPSNFNYVDYAAIDIAKMKPYKE